MVFLDGKKKKNTLGQLSKTDGFIKARKVYNITNFGQTFSHIQNLLHTFDISEAGHRHFRQSDYEPDDGLREQEKSLKH